MRIAVPHNTTLQKARRIIELKLEDAQNQYGNYAEEIEHEWDGDTLLVSLKAKGLKATGTLEITETDVIIDGKLPLIAKPFESKIRNALAAEAESMFRTA